MPRHAPNIQRTANRVLLAIENAVRVFPRYHKYAVGAELRAGAMLVSRSVYRAWREKGRRLQRLHELSTAVDDLRLTLQLAKHLQAFRSFGQFEALAREVRDLGRQCGGWLKETHAKGQNVPVTSTGQRTQILSSRTAPQGAM